MASFLVFSIQEEGFRDLLGRFAKWDDRAAEIQRESLRDLGREYVDVLQGEAPKDTGDLREGITFKTYERKGATELRITSKQFYTVFVLRGTKPHSAPVSALQGWADRHGIDVWAVWGSIKKHGTSMWSQNTYGDRANRFQARAEMKMQPRIENMARSMSERLANYLVGI